MPSFFNSLNITNHSWLESSSEKSLIFQYPHIVQRELHFLVKSTLATVGGKKAFPILKLRGIDAMFVISRIIMDSLDILENSLSIYHALAAIVIST
jgi:hypothetical protein